MGRDSDSCKGTTTDTKHLASVTLRFVLVNTNQTDTKFDCEGIVNA